MFNSIEIPIIGGMQSRARIGDLALYRVAAIAPPIVATNWTAPKGMLNKIYRSRVGKLGKFRVSMILKLVGLLL